MVLECDLAHVHGPILFEVGPGSVDDGDVVLFVAWGFLHKRGLHSEHLGGDKLTFYRVGLGELGEVHDEVLGEVIPLLALLHA